MSVFQHPYLARGIVQTAYGAFEVSRGCVEIPDDLGEALGWRRLDRDGEPSTNVERSLRGPSAHVVSVAAIDTGR